MVAERRSADRTLLTQGPEPELVIHWHDPVTDAVGYVVIDTLARGVAFGGVRIAKTLHWTDLAALARIGTLRYQLASVPIGGARLGLHYDPEAADVEEVLGRFLTAMNPLLSTVLSVGPDLHVPAPQLDRVLESRGLLWRMEAVRRSQGWPKERWVRYNELMDEVDSDGNTLRDLQVAMSAVFATLEMGEFLYQRTQTIAVLGAGPLGTQIARLAARLGATVVGVGSSSAGVYAAGGLNPAVLESGARVSMSLDPSHMFITLDEFYSLPVDALILASNDAVTIDNVGRLRAGLIVEAAARSVSGHAEKVLVARGTPVLPSFAVTTGAVLAADSIFRDEVRTAVEVRDYVERQVRAMIRNLARLSSTLRISLREAGVRLAFHRRDSVDSININSESSLHVVTDEPPEVM